MARAKRTNQKAENVMPNYKVVVHRDRFGTKPVYINKQVDSRKLSEIIYGLTCEYPGCSISFYPEKTYIITKSQSIKGQLEKFLGGTPQSDN